MNWFMWVKKLLRLSPPEVVVEPPLHGCGHRAKSFFMLVTEGRTVCASCYIELQKQQTHMFSPKPAR